MAKEQYGNWHEDEHHGYFSYENDPFAQGARDYQQQLINEAVNKATENWKQLVTRLTHNLDEAKEGYNYYKRKSEEQAEELRELRKRLAIAEASTELMRLRIAETRAFDERDVPPVNHGGGPSDCGYGTWTDRVTAARFD